MPDVSGATRETSSAAKLPVASTTSGSSSDSAGAVAIAIGESGVPGVTAAPATVSAAFVRLHPTPAVDRAAIARKSKVRDDMRDTITPSAKQVSR
jgi:hypothetical protein